MKYNVEPSEGVSTPRGTIWIERALAQDANGEVDTLEVIGSASIPGLDGVPFSVPTDSIPGFMLVEFKPGTVTSGHHHLAVQDVESNCRDHLLQWGFAGGQKVFRDAVPGDTIRQTLNGDTIRVHDLSRWYVVKVRDHTPLAVAMGALTSEPGISRVRPARALVPFVTPNDPQLFQQWHLANTAEGIRAPLGWDVRKGSSDMLVAVLDNGVDYWHGDLEYVAGVQNHLIQGYDYGEDDSNVGNDTPSSDPVNYGHGTATAGLVAAITDNNYRVAGVLWQGRVLFQKTSERLCFFTLCAEFHPDWAVADAIYNSLSRGARVISMSFGIPVDDHFKGVYDELADDDVLAQSTYMAYRLGVSVVAAAGNDGNDIPNLPAAFPWVVCVGATTSGGQRASFSNIGPHLDVVAPGEALTTLAIGGGTVADFGGTSGSTPIMAGVNALVTAESEVAGLGLTNEDAFKLIERTARDVLGTPSGPDDLTGWGLIDAGAAMAHLRAPYAIQRATVAGTTVTLTMDNHDRVFIGNGGLPGGQYYEVKQYEVKTHVSLCAPAVETPLVWGRERQSIGWSQRNANEELPYAGAVNVTTTGFDVVTYVYWIGKDVQGRNVNQWWPCTPQQARMAYTAISSVPLSGVEVQGPHLDCSVNLTAAVCGNAVGQQYRWYERLAGGAWSGIVGTNPIYSRYLPNADMEFRSEVQAGAITVADTHYVAYRNCTVTVSPSESPRQLSLAVSPNPSGGLSVFSVDVPSAQQVTLGVYDVSGRLLRRMVDQVLPPGTHRFEWDLRETSGTRVGSGLYFVRLPAASGERKARLAVVR